MSESAKDFVCQWVAKNIHDEPYVRADAPDPRPVLFATRCKADGEVAGWTDEQLSKAASDLHGAGSLEACMALEIDLCAQKHLAEVGHQHS